MQIPAELTAVLLAVATAIITVAAKWLLNKITKIDEKISSPIVNKLIDELMKKYIPEAVASVDQSYVDQLKKYGAWSPDQSVYELNRSVALEKAIEAITSIMPDEFKKVLDKYFNDVPATLKTHIESYIKSQKTTEPTEQETCEQSKIIVVEE